MALPLLFMAGATLVRAATPAIARYLAKQGLKRATGAAARKPVSSTVTSINQAQKLKPATKVVGKKPTASIAPTATKPKTAAGSAPKPLKADPKQRINTPAPKTKPKDTGLKSAATLVSAASLLAAIPRGEKKEAKATTAKTKTSPSYRGGNAGAKRSKNVDKAAAATGEKKSTGLSKFEQAFADARSAGKKEFSFTNRAGKTEKFTTARADKKPLPKKGKK